jgi:putative DNA primase/helicase
MPTFEEEFNQKFQSAQQRASSDSHQQSGNRRDRSTNREKNLLRLDRRDPMRSARNLLDACFLDSNGRPLLQKHRGIFWHYRGSCYRPADDDTIRAAAWKFLELAFIDEGLELLFKPTRSRVSDVIDALSSVCHLDSDIEPPVWLEDEPGDPEAGELFPVSNGLLHLPTGRLLTPTPRFFGLAASDVEFNPSAPDPKCWLDFLSDLFGDDVEAINTLQEYFGYTLAPDTSQQKIMLVVGPTRSGKGTIARAHMGLLGRDNVAGPTLASLQTNFGLAPLIGKSLAIVSDARLSARADQAIIVERLLSISGEDAITIDRKFLPTWTGRLPTRFLLLSNELPRLSDSSGALAKRFIVLVLEQSFYGHEDRALTTRLLNERSSILKWALAGHARLRERGHFLQPTSGRDAIEQLETLSSPVTAFVRESCRIGTGLTTATHSLYQAWCEWCSSNGRRQPGTAQTLGRDLKAAFPKIKTTNPLRSQDDRTRYYEGIGLRDTR